MINENTYHSRSLCTSPRSAAKTPSWQVTLESTRMIVFGSARARLRCTGWGPSVGGQAPVFTDRIVKYIANSAAKNINSDESLSLIHISEPTRLGMISYAVFCLKKKNIYP